MPIRIDSQTAHPAGETEEAVRMPDLTARAIIQRREDALQVVLLLATRLERDFQELGRQTTQIREPLSRVAEAVRDLQYVELTTPGRTANRRMAPTRTPREMAIALAEQQRIAIEALQGL